MSKYLDLTNDGGRPMRIELTERLSKLHEDAGCCRAEFSQSQREIIWDDTFESHLQTLGALADETRLAIVKLVQRYGRLCVCEIECAFELSHSTVIHHLNHLSNAGLLEPQRDGKWTYYSLSPKCATLFASLSAYLSETPPKPASCCCSRPSPQ